MIYNLTEQSNPKNAFMWGWIYGSMSMTWIYALILFLGFI